MATINVSYVKPHCKNNYTVLGGGRDTEGISSTETSVQSSSTARSDEVVQIVSDHYAHINVGSNPTATTSDLMIAPNVPTLIYVPAGETLAAYGTTVGGSTPSVTDIMEGIGDFADPSLWQWDAGQAEVTGGVAAYNTSVSFRGVFVSGGKSVTAPPSQTFDLEFTISNTVTPPSRFWINVQPRDSGGSDIGSSFTIYDTDGSFNDPEITGDGTYTKTAALTTPALTADIEIFIDVVTGPAEFDLDDFKLTY